MRKPLIVEIAFITANTVAGYSLVISLTIGISPPEERPRDEQAIVKSIITNSLLQAAIGINIKTIDIKYPALK